MAQYHRFFSHIFLWMPLIVGQSSGALPLATCNLSLTFHENWFLNFKSLVGKPVTMNESGSKKFDGDIEYVARGIPNGAKLRTAYHGEIFRHYATTDENVQKIINSSSLVAGNLPYITQGGGIRVSYVDLTGIFLTLPNFRPDQIGVSKESINAYVDVYLPSGTEVLDLEPGIILVPGPGNVPPWLRKYYEQWQHSVDSVPNYMHVAMKRFDEQGGIIPPLEQKITIRK